VINLEKNNFCFCTLTVGKRYRTHAFDLAKDIEKHSPGTAFVVLTDKPQDFRDYPNVLAFKHQQQSVGGYHDKRFVISKSLSMFNSCIFMDADMRILSHVSPNLKLLPGITARSCARIIKHNQGIKNIQAREREVKIINNVANKLNLNLEEDKNIFFIHEFLFTVTRDCGREIEFLNYWDKIAFYFELNKFYIGEGNAMGLAAAKAGFPVRHDTMDGFDFFKDRIEKVRIQKGEAEPNEKLVYFERHKMLEYPNRSLLSKIWGKLGIGKFFRKAYPSLRLIIVTLKDFNFYYR